jgi:5-methylthioadenosine/S-adenosylhomocysteine deaminase
VSLAVTDAVLEGRVIGIRAEDGLIAEIGEGVRPRQGDALIEAGGMPAVPGLVNAHTHAAMTLLRGHGDDLPLSEWLEEKIWPAEARLEAEDVYWGTRLACLEMIRSGTVGFWDMYWHPEATARAVADAGVRATIGAPLIDLGAAADGAGLRESATRSIEELSGAEGLISPALAPHALYTVSGESLSWIAERAEADSLPIHIHLSETEEEVERCLHEHGKRPAAYLDAHGVLGPRTLLAHGTWLDDDELDLIAERGATLVSNPVANMKLAVGRVFPLDAAIERGIPVGLGTDGAASNNSLDLFADMKALALIQKHAARDAAAAPAPLIWSIATGARSPLLGSSGRLAPGEPADFLLLHAETPWLALGELETGLVYGASGEIVDTTVVAGRPVMRGREVADAPEILAEVRERARRLRD